MMTKNNSWSLVSSSNFNFVPQLPAVISFKLFFQTIQLIIKNRYTLHVPHKNQRLSGLIENDLVAQVQYGGTGTDRSQSNNRHFLRERAKNNDRL